MIIHFPLTFTHLIYSLSPLYFDLFINYPHILTFCYYLLGYKKLRYPLIQKGISYIHSNNSYTYFFHSKVWSVQLQLEFLLVQCDYSSPQFIESPYFHAYNSLKGHKLCPNLHYNHVRTIYYLFKKMGKHRRGCKVIWQSKVS